MTYLTPARRRHRHRRPPPNTGVCRQRLGAARFQHLPPGDRTPIARHIARTPRCQACHRVFDKHGMLLLDAIDHCHTTGAVRGRLCRYCNMAEGRALKNAERDCRAAARGAHCRKSVRALHVRKWAQAIAQYLELPAPPLERRLCAYLDRATDTVFQAQIVNRTPPKKLVF